VFVMLDLDIGMNDWLTEPFRWDDAKTLDRGKVMTAEMLEAGADFGRYKDVDGDGIPFRTYPGTHPSKGAYFTRGTSRDPYARYSEEGPVYQANMLRLLKKFDTARDLVPGPVIRVADKPTRLGVIYYGSTAPAMDEALCHFAAEGVHLDAMRIRAFPFSDEVYDFVAVHEQVFLVEQNRDGQLRTLLINEGEIDPARLTAVLHFEGAPITARFIVDQISALLAAPEREAAE